jgi:hypothetical protein
VFIEQPLLTLRLQSTGYYAFTLALMLLALGGRVLGARAFAGAVTRPLERGGHGRPQHLGARRPGRGAAASNPPAEIAQLLEDVNGMQSAPRESYRSSSRR